MRSKVLKNLFAEDPARQIRAQIIRRQGAGTWLVREKSGQQLSVTSDQDWQPGIDWVTVQSGRIVGLASAAKNINVYEV